MQMYLKRGISNSTHLIGFTLAEVLITLGIIGVVSAMTIPTLVANYQQKSMDTQANTFNRKLGEALKIMNTQSELAGHGTTQAFVNELSKHIKILKVCEKTKLKECFAEEFATNTETYKVADLQQGKNLNQGEGYKTTDTVGVLFADGVSALIAYNKDAKQDPFSNRVVGVSSEGEGLKDRTISLSTDALAILYDLSGSSGVNTYGTNDGGKFKDIRGINVTLKIGADILNLGTSYSFIDCSSANSSSDDYKKYCGPTPSGFSDDYWAGAKKVCADNGMKLPSITELQTVYAEADNVEKDTPSSGGFWSSTEKSYDIAEELNFYRGIIHSYYKNYQYKVICVAN